MSFKNKSSEERRIWFEILIGIVMIGIAGLIGYNLFMGSSIETLTLLVACLSLLFSIMALYYNHIQYVDFKKENKNKNL